jgi:hypothetical protein
MWRHDHNENRDFDVLSDDLEKQEGMKISMPMIDQVFSSGGLKGLRQQTWISLLC